MAKGRFWTEGEFQQVRAMLDDGKEWPEIARRIDRPCESSKGIYRKWLNRQRAAQLKNVSVTAVSFAVADPSPKAKTRPAAKLAALQKQAEMRPTGHATITAAAFGDPLPGRSALDQRRAMKKGVPADGFDGSAS